MASIPARHFDLRKLTEYERDVLVRVQLDADASYKKIARDLGVRPTTVSSALERLVECGLIVRRPVVDLNLLRIGTYFVYLRPESQIERKRVLSKLHDVEGISFLHEVEGEYSIFAGYNSAHQRGVSPLLETLRNEHGFQLGARTVGRFERQLFFGRKYLSSKSTPRPLSIGTNDSDVKVIDTDIAILRAMCGATRASREEISRATKLPGSTITFRLERLKEKKVIAGYVYAFASIPRGIVSARLLVRLRGDKSCSATVESFCRRHPNVVTLVEISGSWDFEIAIEVESSRDVRGVADALEAALSPSTATISSLVVTSTVVPLRFPFSTYKSFVAHSDKAK